MALMAPGCLHTVSMRFTTTIQGSGNKTGIKVPAEVVAELNAGKRPPVLVTLNDRTYRSSIAVMAGVSLISLSAANRELTGVSAGDEVEVDVELDTAPRIVEVPADLAAALAAEPVALDLYETLSHSAQRRYVEPIGNAKTADTRSRRIAKVIEDLQAGKK